ncbi:hypothetical protein [Allochromatium vinosum]|uniref:hypothetical protein n=1 Tax=Allochromatium vinosum TaxID=1049 RepID=UPI001904D2DD|nr:hypothetical protein [Allochromatium vinosum]MBK1653958.1 hypothetical protein [Allochromatium vinosum]
MKALPLTRSATFGSISPNSPDLFEVADGVTLDAALETASNLTEGAIDIARSIGCRISRSEGSAELWAAIHALESVAAILEAIQGGLLELEHPKPDPAPEPANADPETLRRVWIDMAKMAADELAKLDRAGESKEGGQ